MNEIMIRTIDFFINNIPPWRVVLLVGPVCITWALLCLSLAGYLKRRLGWKTGYSRKTFHFLIFGSVSLLHYFFGTKMVCLFGGMTTLVIFMAIVMGDGNMLYEAMAREKDAPHRTYYILAPYVATLIGGLAANILFGQFAVFGYLVTGLGDAVGEPVGARFGRHTYRVPSFWSVRSVRSLEGSTAVCFACLLALAIGFIMVNIHVAGNLHLIVIVAVLCTLVEAVSPHGWDNATLQIIPSWLMNVLLVVR